MVVPTAKAAWFYFCDHQGWIPCGEESSNQLENHWQGNIETVSAFSCGQMGGKDGRPKPVPILKATVDGRSYAFDVIRMTQTNSKSGKTRPLKRFSCDPNVAWQFDTGKEKFANLSQFATAVLEHTRLQAALSPLATSSETAPVTFITNGTSYKFDTVSMTQKNAETGTERHLKRLQLKPAASPATPTPAVVSEEKPAPSARAPPPPSATGSKRSREAPTSVKEADLPSTEEDVEDALPKTRPKAEEVAATAAVPTPPAVSGEQRLLFPSISTSIFAFDLDKAAAVACAEISEFFKKYPATDYPNLRLTLIDAPKGPDTATIHCFKKHWKTVGGGDPRLEFITGDVTNPGERGTAKCIVNAANIRFYGGKNSGGFNRAIHEAAGMELEKDTKTRFPKGGSVGPAFDVPLRATSPLYTQGTRHIIHVIGPNMNPERPNCLYDDYTLGNAQLKQCYHNMLSTFAELALKK